MIDGGGGGPRAQPPPPVGSATWADGLGFCKKKKKSEQSVSSKPVNHIPPWSRLRFFPPGACPDFSQRQMITWEVQDEINPALSGLLLVTVFITERESKLEQLVISKMKATKLRERWMTGASSVIPHFLTTAVLTLSGPN